MSTRLGERRNSEAPDGDARVDVREIIARATLVESDGERGVALVEIELCLEDGRRVKTRSDDRLRIEVDLSDGLAARAAVNTAVRAHVRTALLDGSAAGWPALASLGRFGAAWEPGDSEPVVSVGV